jgi:serine/threonine protein kinase
MIGPVFEAIKQMSLSDEEVFTQALMLSSNEEQDQFVAQVCRDEESQRQRVMGLMGSHRMLKSGKTSFVLDRAQEVLESLDISKKEFGETQIGPYRIMQLLGEGGMGLVYQAEQMNPLRRRVALKILKPGMNSCRVLMRFDLERHALSGMDHPGITRIFDAGLTDSGLPFFAMELVKGLPITDYCSQHQLHPVQRIELMITVCHAIQHAHQRGIIHRDIKPANILVTQIDGKPQPKVIDFGIAKAINDSMTVEGQFTFHGELIGTPTYMSPEQAASGIEGVDVRTDVYSLGVLLYELLTGETPLAESGLKLKNSGVAGIRQLLTNSRIEPPSSRVLHGTEAYQRAHTEKHPTEPKSKAGLPLSRDILARFLRGEVDCIILKSLSRDPEERYQSVSDLCRDLERFISGRPIEAVPPSLFYQMRKLVQRHRAIAMVTSLAALLIFAAFVAVVGFGIQTIRANRIAHDRLNAVTQMQKQIITERDRAIDAEFKTRLLVQLHRAPRAIGSAMNRFMKQHFDTMCALNPSLELYRSDPETPLVSLLGYRMLIQSDLLLPHSRVVVKEDEKWLRQILAEFSQNDSTMQMGLLQSSVLIASDVSGAAGETAAQVPYNGDFSTTRAHASDADAPISSVSSEIVSGADFHFPIQNRIEYLKIVADELRDIRTPLLAKTEDDIGLCLLDLNQPSLAVEHFEESLRIRQSFPEQSLTLPQTRLFLAEALASIGKRDAAAIHIDEARNSLRSAKSKDDEEQIQRLNEIADRIAESLRAE